MGPGGLQVVNLDVQVDLHLLIPGTVAAILTEACDGRGQAAFSQTDTCMVLSFVGAAVRG